MLLKKLLGTLSLLLVWCVAVVAQPAIGVSPASINVTINGCNDSITIPVTVSNTGTAPLNFFAGNTRFPYDSIYVGNADGSNWSVIDPATNTTVGGTTAAGSRNWRTAISPDASQIWVSNNFDNTVQIFDATTRASLAVIPMPGGPAGIDFTPDGSVALVCDRFSGTLTSIDVGTLTPITSAPGYGSPQDVVVSPDGRYAYVCGGDFGNGLQKVDLLTGTIVAVETTTVNGCHSISITPDGSTLYISSSWNGTVYVVDTKSFALITTIFGFSQAHGLDITPDGQFVYVCDMWNSQIQVIDVATNTVATTIPDPRFTRAWDLVIDRTGTYAYVSNPFNAPADVTIIDIGTNTIIGDIPTGLGPRGLASYNKPLSWVAQLPNSGTIGPGGSTIVNVRFYSRDLIAGVYNGFVTFDSDDPVNPLVSIPVSLTVNGSPTFTVRDSCMAMDTIQEFATTTDSFYVANWGCDTLFVSDITNNLPAFSADVTNFFVLPCDSQMVTATFAPTAPGTYLDSFNVQTNVGDSLVCVSGTALAAPQISISPPNFNVTINDCCDSTTLNLTITNTAPSADLDWTIATPGFEDDFDNLNPSNWAELNGVIQWSGCGADNGDGLYFNGGGTRRAITTDINTTNAPFISFRVYMSNGADGCNAAENNEDMYLDYSTDGGGTWTNFGVYDEAVYTPAFVQVNEPLPVGAQTPSTRFRFRQINFDCANCDIAMLDDVFIPGTSFVTVDPDTGTTTGSSFTNVDVEFFSCDLAAGTYVDSLAISSNDPNDPIIYVPFSFTVNGPAILDVSDICLDLDTAMQFTTNTDSFYVYNLGCDTLDVSGISNVLTEYSVDTMVFNVPPGDSLLVHVDFTPTTVGTFLDTLLIQTNAGDTTICLVGEGVEAPSITVVPSSVTVSSTSCCDTVSAQVTISNGSPVADLDWVIVPPGGLVDFFDPAENPANWSSILLGTANTDCGSMSGNALHFNGAGPERSATTISLNAAGGGNVDFAIVFGTGGGNCENADGGEDVALEYSTNNGATWTQMGYYDEAIYGTWTSISEPIPLLAQTTNTMFRWRQVSFSSCTGCDNWAMDNVSIGGTGFTFANPDTATTGPSGSTLVDLSFISCGLTAGTYIDSFLVTSNDPLNPSVYIPFDYTVVGAPEVAPSVDCLDLDTIIEFNTASDTVYILNTGCDTLFVSNITNTLPEYSVDTLVFFVLPGDSMPVEVTFSPTSPGQFDDTLNILTNDIDTTVCLTGFALDRPIISFNPDTFNINLNCADTIIDTLKIYNSGLGDLHYEITGDTVQVLALTFGVDMATEYPNTLAAINQYFTEYNVTELNTTDPAVLAAAMVGMDVVLIPERESGSTALWTPLGPALQTFATNGGWVVFCGSGSGQSASMFNTGLFSGSYAGSSTGTITVVNNTDCLADTVSATFSGMSASFHYNITDPDAVVIAELAGNTYAAYRPIGQGRAILIASDFFSYNNDIARLISNSIRCSNGSIATWITPSMRTDTVLPGDSSCVQLIFSSVGLNAGSYTTYLALESDDPLNPIDSVVVNLTVTGQGEIALSDICLDLDSIVEYSTHQDTFTIYNTGCDTLWISDITNVFPEFSVDTTNFNIPILDSMQVVVTFSPTSVGTFYDTLLIQTNVGDTTICLEGDAFARPILDHSPDTLFANLPGCCDTVDVDLTLYNVGGSDLDFNITNCTGIELDTVLNNFNNFYTNITSLIPTPFLFTDGDVGNNIPDGGNDMYDGGNQILTDVGGFLAYSDNLISTDPIVGPTGEYFTRKQPGIFMFAGDLDGNTFFRIDGNTGADGSGIVDGTTITLPHCGTSFTGYVKRTYSAFDPSINQIIIVENNPGYTQSFSFNTDDDTHTLDGLSGGTRVYYILFASQNGGFVDDATMTSIMQEFLNSMISGGSASTLANPSSGNIVPTDSTQVVLSVNGCNYAPDSTYYDSIAVSTNNPLDPISWIPLVIIKDPLPTAPVANDTSACFGNPIPDLVAVHGGDSAVWYDDGALTSQVFVGNTFPTGQTAIGTYTYYVVSYLDSCPSPSDTVTLTINNAPVQPSGLDVGACFGDPIPDLFAATIGTAQWYSDGALTNLVFTGDPFPTGQTAAGTYTYYVTDSLTGCPAGPADTMTLTISPLPATPVGSNQTACEGDPIPDLTATGTNLSWYTDPTLTTLVFVGNPFTTGNTVAGTYTYYVTQSPGGCESLADTITLTINGTAAPLANDVQSCFGDPTPDLTATGTALQWYDDAGLTNLVGTGTPFATGETAVGIYTYYVTQTLNSCESPPTIVTLAIDAIPTAPIANDTAICFGDPTPDLIAAGINIQWYDDGALTNLVGVGSPFLTGQTAVGTYTYYVTQTAGICEGPADTVTLTINAVPVAPTAPDVLTCFGQPTPDLTATGTNVLWYDDPGLTNLVFTGSAFPTGETAVGIYTYFVRDSVNGCYSPDVTVTLTINTAPTQPNGLDTFSCFGDPVPDLEAPGGANLQWYDDGALTNLVGTGNPFATGQTAVGNYTYYVTDSLTGCPPGPADTVELVIYAIPAAPISSDESACFGDPVPDFTAAGDSIRWYDDGALTILLGNGNTFATGQIAPGSYTYYVTTTDLISGCESPADTVVLDIYLTAPPTADSDSSCFGFAVPDLVATGTNIQWYDDGALTNLVGTGSPFATGQTAVGTYTYYVTQTLNGCESVADTVELIIHPIPAAPVANDESVCFGQPVPDLFSTGINVQWYDDGALTNLVGVGSPFATGQTNVGTYTYYVTQTVNGCESLADTVTLDINPIPTATTASDVIVCFGDPTPDLTAVGTNIQWYDDGALTNLVGAGSPFATGQTAVGIYTYYVTQTAAGCEGPADTVTLTISTQPVTPSVADVDACFGDPVPDLTATGSIVQWYDDGALTNLVFTGSPFATGQTAVGTYTYYITDSVPGCTVSNTDTAVLTIHPIPTAPVSSDAAVCFGFPVPDLTSTGSNVQWYDDGALTNLVGAGTPFATGQTAVGTYTYYVTQTVNGCESLADTVTLTIDAIPTAPLAADVSICFGDATPDLTSTGSNVQWYDDGALTNLVGTGTPFATGQTAVGTYTYYVTQTVNNCESPSDTVTLTINPLPAAPVGTDVAICFGSPTPDLTAVGTNLQWYDDGALTNLVGAGSPFATGQTAVGIYTYYVTQTIGATGCEGPADTVTLTINAIPVAPIAEDTTICFGDPVPDLTATGSNIQWYDDGALTNLVGAGSPFATGQAGIGTYTYYVTQTVNGCESLADTVTLNISTTPPTPVALDTAICFGSPTPDLTAAGSNIVWYDDAGLTNIVFTGSVFPTGQTAPGTYTYYVTDSINGCGQSLADTATLIIHPIPSTPVATDTAICFGAPTPDLTATGTNVQWYDDGALTNLVFTGSPFATGQTAPGTYTYYITQSANGCESLADTVTLTINVIPSAPTAANDSACFGSPTPDLIAVGSNIEWFDDGALTNLVGTGSPFATGETAVGTYTYYVTQTVNGCQSSADTLTLTINPIPAAPVATDEAICFGAPTPDLTATGTNLNWYDDGGLTNLVGTGSPFATGQTAAGTYTYYVTQTIAATGCEGPADTVTLTIHPIPSAPVANDTTICFGSPTPDLVAAGSNIQWYDDGALTNLVFTGSPFATGQTALGTYTYYVTQTVNGCVSPSDTVTLTIITTPPTPTALDTAICFGSPTPDLTSTGTNPVWYDDAGLTNVVFIGNTFPTGQTAPGTYTYYVTDSINFCGQTIPDTAVLTIHPIPTAPVANDTAICFGSPTPDLTGTGTNINWYDDGALTNLVGTGSPFTTGQTVVGTYTYYVTQSANGCESLADTVTLTINAIPTAPIADNDSACFGQPVPDLTAIGTNINWYDDGALTNLVNAGSPFATGQTGVGVYTYYVTQTINGCESPADTVTLSINPIPAAPVANDVAICFGSPTPDLTATGTNINWYDDGGLTNLIATGSPFATGQTAVGTYTYYVTQTIAATGCEGPADTVSLTIHPIPVAPVADDTTICLGSPVPDLTATGANIEWYDDGALTNLVFTGSPFATGQTALGTYTYYVTQTVNGCVSPSDTVTLTIITTPPTPTALDTAICFGSPTPDLTSTGTNPVWYDDAGLTNIVFTGNTFPTGQTAPGTYTYYVTDSINFCGQTIPDTAVLTIHPIPTAPVANDTAICFGSPTPDLTATGTNVNWYDDGALTNLVGTGSPFATGQTAVGTYTYYVTQSANGCESLADTVTLTINAIPAAPVAADVSTCVGSTVPDLIATGTNINWYDDGALTNLVFAGSPFATGQSAVGVYTYYVTQTVNGCESPADTVTLEIFPLPAAPVAVDATICFGDPTPDLTATGTNNNWYDDGALTNLVGTGSPFATGQTAVGTYTYYVTQTDVNGCESLADTVTLTINAIPAAVVSNDTAICFGAPTPNLTATGTNVQWYDDAALTNLVFTGSPFATGQTAVGSYTYYVTQTVNGCESPSDTVVLDINAIPTAPIADNDSVCFGFPTPDLTATGTNINWYDDGALASLVGSGATFATGQTAVGTYTYYVTQTVNGCESPADTVTLSINNALGAPTALDTTICFGGTVPNLTATGSNLEWYDDAALTNLVFSGASFPTGQSAAGTYTYYVTQSGFGCQGVPDTAVLVISAPPVNPNVNDEALCFGLPVPDFTVTGTNISWYDDGALTNLVGTGSPFATGQTAPGTYTYYVTDSTTACPATPADTVVLTIHPTPAAPVAVDTGSCFGSTTPDLTATGSNINWYDDGSLTNLVGSGSSFATGQTAIGTYTYYVTQTVNGCESPADTLVLEITPLPTAPSSNDTIVCAGGPAVQLPASGTGIQWYDDGALTNLVGIGNVFNTGQTAAGIYTYYITQSVNGCEGPSDTIVLEITNAPGAPTAQNQNACISGPIPDLTATGANLLWYDDAGLTNQVGTGSPFATGQTAAGVYTYYVVDSIGGCGAGPVTMVTLTISSTTPAPTAPDVAVCSGQPVPDLVATTGSNLYWYDDAGLTNIVFNGNPFATGQTGVGTYTYYVTDSLAGCGQGPATTVTLTINDAPNDPNVPDSSICFGDPIPDIIGGGANLHWYAKPGPSELVHVGDTLNPSETAVGVWTYYVQDSLSGCPPSAVDTFVLTINPNPLITINTYNAYIALGDSVQLTAYNGINYSWSPATDLNTTTGATVWASPTTTTTYTVIGYNDHGCSNTADVTVHVGTVGINDGEDLGFLQNLTIYPNPAFGQFVVEFESSNADVEQIKLVNAIGQEVATSTPFAAPNGQYREEFILKDYDSGVYFLQIVTDKGVVVRKVVLAH